MNNPVTISIQQAITLAKQHQVAGQLAHAEVLYRAVLEQEPNADAMNLLGVLYCQKGDTASGVPWLNQAIAQCANNAEFHNNLGCAYRDAGQAHEAIASFVTAIHHNAYIPAVYQNLGTSLLALNERELAEFAQRLSRWIARRLKSAGWSKSLLDIATERELAQFYEKLGSLLFVSKQYFGAIICYQHVVNSQPQSTFFLNCLAASFIGTGEHEQAIEVLKKSLALNPNDAQSLVRLAVVYNEAQYFDKAAPHCRAALADQNLPTGDIAMLALCLQQANELEAAELAFLRVLKNIPDDATTHMFLGINLLKRGKYTQGWQEFEWRFLTKQWRGAFEEGYAQITLPQWHGENIKGKRLLIRCEQGFGDSLQFIRFVPGMASMGLDVTVMCQPELIRLFLGIGHFKVTASTNKHENNYDFQCWLMSLPHLLRIADETQLFHGNYLKADPEKISSWAQRMADDRSYRVALVWGGNPRSENQQLKETDGRRSIPLPMFAPLSNLPISLYSAQKGPAATQLGDASVNFNLIDYTKDFTDFSDTAAFLENIDLLISVDTSVAHLAGALGKPVWLLSRFDGCWRWLTDIDHSPWYPHMRIFRQKTPGDWSTIMQEVTRALEDLLLINRPKAGTTAPANTTSGNEY